MRNIALDGVRDNYFQMKRNAQKDITRCICDFNPGIGDFICCDKCQVWQHMRCMEVEPTKIPKVYECEQCSPRKYNKEAAVQLQLLLRAEETSSDEEEKPPQPSRKIHHAKRSRKMSSNSVKSEESVADSDDRVDYRRTYKEVKENMYSPSIKHRLEPKTEALPSFGGSPPSMTRIQPQAAGYPTPRIYYPAMLHLLNHGPSKIVITRQPLKPGTFISDFMGHFKQLTEFYEEVGGKSNLFKRPLNYVLHYPLLDLCVDTREYGNVARFIRRSCHPNALAKSYLRDGKLHIGIYASESIVQNTEITIAFNFSVEHYQFTQTCSCSSPGCLVTKNNDFLTTRAKKTFSRTNSIDSTTSEDDHKKQRLSREELKMQNYIQVFEKLDREEERKRNLSENLKSPSRDNTSGDVLDENCKGNKRRRKGSGKKLRKGSGSSIPAPSPEHFTFEGPSRSGASTPNNSPCVPALSGPAYTVINHILTRHHVKYNGYEADIELRPMNTTPSNRQRQNFQLKNSSTLITPIKVQKDGFIVPIHGSLLNFKEKVTTEPPTYKTTKKRWLENFIQEGGVKSPVKSPITSPRPEISPAKEINTPEKETSPLLNQGVPHETEMIEAATRTLNLSDEPNPIPTTPNPTLTPTAEPAKMEEDHKPATFPLPLNLTQDTPLISTPGYNSSLSSEPATPLSGAPAEKKKRVSLADYRKRQKIRSSKPPSLSNESDGRPDFSPIFEPISPEDSTQSLMAEFTRPSLSESISDESLNPSKFRKIDYSEQDGSSAVDHHHGNDITTSPSHGLSLDAFSKIKEILSQSNPSLVPSKNLNVTSPIMKSNLSLYDPNGASSNQFQFPGQYTEDSYSRETNRLKSTLSPSEFSRKYFNDSDKS